jgi:hypothetical protein
MRVPEIVMEQLRRSDNWGRVRQRQHRFVRLHLGNDDNRQRVERHRRRLLDVYEGAAVVHLAQLRRDVLEPREDIVRSVARVMVDRAELLVDRQTMGKDPVFILCGVIDPFWCHLLLRRRRNFPLTLARLVRRWMLNWQRRCSR